MPRFLVQETAVHWVDVFRFLLGAPQAVYADLRRLNPAIAGEDAGVILFDHPGGVTALFDGNRLLDHSSDNTRRTMGEALFEGTKGTLTLFGDGRVEKRAFGAVDSTVVLAPDRWDGFGGDCVHALQRHVTEALRAGQTPENTARDYCGVLRIRDAIYRSAETGSKIRLGPGAE
ncbi:MAG: Gfo/Idh/MocA family oxidoreductase [Roseobacter sp.]|jgi:predicted dehydrogenase|nr:Gfo/Idh/MocA family oxidoreductase [Roseobacter sp.]